MSAPPVVARIGDLMDTATELTRVATDDPGVVAVVGQPATGGATTLCGLECDAEQWGGRDNEAALMAMAREYQTGERVLQVPVERTIRPRSIVRRRSTRGLFWFECYLPFIPEAGRADIAAVDTWGTLMELPELVKLAHQALTFRTPDAWESAGASVVQAFANTPEISAFGGYPGSRIIGLDLGGKAELLDTFRLASHVQWGDVTARVAGLEERFGGIGYLDVTPSDRPDGETTAWAPDPFGLHADVLSSVIIDQQHNKIPTAARLVQSWINFEGVIGSSTHYPNAWNVVIDASGDPAVKAALDRGDLNAVSIHAFGREVPTVYPSELVSVAVDPYGGRYDRTRDQRSR